jgi:hypothetical protein
LDNGVIPHYAQITGPMPINLQKGEQIIWLFNNVSYHAVRTKTRYVGGSHGVSIRIAKGLYYRVGAFKGERVQTKNLVLEGIGALVITNKSKSVAAPRSAARSIRPVRPLS